MAELSLEKGEVIEALQICEKGLLNSYPFHSERIRFYCVQMRAFYAQDNFREAEKSFALALDVLYYHLGPKHPLHITVYGIMGFLLS
jgi:hypothetical protein